MAKINRFEDIEAWQKALELTLQIYSVTLREEFGRDFRLRDQVRDAATSIMSNIAEGFERDGDKEFRQFLAVAKGSTGELRSRLYVALGVGYIRQTEFDRLYATASEIARMLRALMDYLGGSPLRGRKYR